MLQYFDHQVFLALDVFHYNKQRYTKKPKQGDKREKYCLLFNSFKCVISKRYNLGRKNSLNC